MFESNYSSCTSRSSENICSSCGGETQFITKIDGFLSFFNPAWMLNGTLFARFFSNLTWCNWHQTQGSDAVFSLLYRYLYCVTIFYFYSFFTKDLVLHWYWALGVESIELILLANFVIQILGAKNTMAYPSNHENIRIGKEGAIPGYMGFVPGVRSHVVGHSFADACKRGLAISDSQRHNSFEKTIHLVCTDLCWKNKYPI
jgi:hypothetical protein